MVLRHRSAIAVLTARGIGAALLCGLLAGCWWQQPGFGADHGRHNPFERTLRPGNVASLTPQWSVTTTGTFSEPVTSRDLVVSTRSVDSGTASVQAFDVDSGDVVWEHTLPPPGFPVPLRPNDVAFVGDELHVGYYSSDDPFGPPPCGDLARLDPETGDVLSTERANPPLSPIVTAGPVTAHVELGVCAPPGGGRLVVRDRATSDVLWTAPAADDAFAPTVDLVQGRVYLNDGASIQAFDIAGCGAATCAPVWTVDLGNQGLNGPVIAGGDLVYAFETFVVFPQPPDIHFGQGRVRALSAATGVDVWQAELAWDLGPSDGQVYGLAVADGNLYVAGSRQMRSGNGVLEAYDAGGCGQLQCEPLWSAPLPTIQGASDQAWPVVAGGVVYAPSPGGLVAYDASGCGAATCAPLATIPLDDGPAEELSVSAGHVLAVTSDGAGSQTLTAFGL